MPTHELNRADFIPLGFDIDHAIQACESARKRAYEIHDRLPQEQYHPNARWLAGQAALLAKHAADTLRLAKESGVQPEQTPGTAWYAAEHHNLPAAPHQDNAPPAGYYRVQPINEYLLPHCNCVGICERGLPGTPQPAMREEDKP